MSWMRESFVLSLTYSIFGPCRINCPPRGIGGPGLLWAGAVRVKPVRVQNGCAVP